MTAATMQKPPRTTEAEVEKETVITGRVIDRAGRPAGGVSVVLLDDSQEFAAELIASPAGTFRFFTAPGTWTLHAQVDAHEGVVTVAPPGAGIHEVEIVLGSTRGLPPPR